MSECFSDDQARAILARAIDLDSRAPTATKDDLRAIASDVGISQASLERALREHATAPTAPRVTGSKRSAVWLAGMGLPLGIGVGSLLASGSVVAALGVMGAAFVASAGLVILEGTTGTLRSFHLKNLMLWGGVAAGSMLSVLLFGADAASVPLLISAGGCVRGWITSGIPGSAAMIAIQRSRRDDSRSDADVEGSSEAKEERLLARGMKRLLGRFGRPLWRAAQQLSLPRVAPAILARRRA